MVVDASSPYKADNRRPRYRKHRPRSARPLGGPDAEFADDATEEREPAVDVLTHVDPETSRLVREAMEQRIQNAQIALLFQLMPSIVPKGWAPALVPRAKYFKVVAAVGDRLLSLFDGKTEYDLGHTKLARRGGAAAWPPLDCCYFVQPTHMGALGVELPRGSKCKNEARILMLVEAGGKGYMHQRNGSLAVSALTPLRILGHVFFMPK